MIHEWFIRNKRHWQSIIGFFQKHGYFEKKKAHQARLPEWARDSHAVIRRTGGKASGGDGVDRQKNEESKVNAGYKHLEKAERKEKMRYGLKCVGIDPEMLDHSEQDGHTNGEKLDACGIATELYLYPSCKDKK